MCVVEGNVSVVSVLVKGGEVFIGEGGKIDRLNGRWRVNVLVCWWEVGRCKGGKGERWKRGKYKEVGMLGSGETKKGLSKHRRSTAPPLLCRVFGALLCFWWQTIGGSRSGSVIHRRSMVIHRCFAVECRPINQVPAFLAPLILKALS
ncbi:hypothetical protein HAX54_043016 [Datura stramonium]|uniref:Uncharacterized protein n=1 Tax=Datura stramonium TaxID=4076 RepID=A0ABS8RNX5_DATST|nr:hypothetical protein [Datura stramonium]